MIDQPLSSGEQTKIFVFALLFIPYVGIGVGVIPVILFSWGLFQAKRNRDFSFIEVSKKYFKSYTIIAFIFVGIPFLGMAVITWEEDRAVEVRLLMSLLIVGILVVPVLYIFLANKLYFKPLQNHKNWVENNSIFSNKPKIENTESPTTKIMKSDGVKSYSVADELLKWAKLKEDGLISETEFTEAKSKILG